MRVGIIDADPQATASLYFADADLPLFAPDTPTLAEFMGVDDLGASELTQRTPEELIAIWRPIPWPAVRLILGGTNIQNGDISLLSLSQRGGVPVYRVLRDDNGAFDPVRFDAALKETLDVIVIDQQPSLTLMPLNCLIAADSVVIPQTMKGLYLATLATYIGNIGEYLEFIIGFEADLEISNGNHVVLPTIMEEQNNQDTDQIADLYRRAPREISQVWYSHSDAIANAVEEYKSTFEYLPPRTRPTSAKAFMNNANAVNDSLVGRALPHLPTRGFAEEFIEDKVGLMARKRKLDATPIPLKYEIGDEGKLGMGGVWGGTAMNMLRQRLNDTRATIIDGMMNSTVSIELLSAKIDDLSGSDCQVGWEDDPEFQALVDNIAQRGQTQAIRVRPANPACEHDCHHPLDTADKFIIQSGRCRLATCRLLDRKVVAVIATVEGEAALADLEERFHENTMRKNLSRFEELLSVGLIADALGDLSQQEIAQRLSVSQNDVSLGRSSVELHDRIVAEVDIRNTPKRAFHEIIPHLRGGVVEKPKKTAEKVSKATQGPVHISVKAGASGALSLTLKGVDVDPDWLAKSMAELVAKKTKNKTAAAFERMIDDTNHFAPTPAGEKY